MKERSRMSPPQNEENSRDRREQGKSSEESAGILMIDVLNGEGLHWPCCLDPEARSPWLVGLRSFFCRALCMCELVWCLLWYLGTKVLP